MRRAALLLAVALAGCVSGRAEPPRPARVAAPATPAAPGYTVRPGDTLSAIAARLGVEMTALARANGLPPPYLIRVGQRLALPGRERFASRPVVQPLPRATPSPPPPPPPAASVPPAVVRTSAPRLAWPADGPLAQRFGEGLAADAKGIAIAAHQGAAVRAAAAGTVTFSGVEPARYGQVVLVDHGGGWVSAYGRLARLVVRPGERVAAGDRLGFIGPSALHFELRRDNQPVDPLPMLPQPL